MNIFKFWHLIGIYQLSRQQKLLLQACISEERIVIRSWNEWKQLVDIENLDNCSNALLCQLYHNLSANQVEDWHMTRLKGVYKQNWYNNQLLFKKLQTILQTFKATGVEAVVLGDAALVLGYCQDLGQLSLGELTLLIHPGNGQKAIATLAELGWTQSQTSQSIMNNEDLCLQFQDRAGTRLNLQAHLFWAMPQEHTDKELWHNSLSSFVGCVNTHIPSSTDLFLNLSTRTFYQNQTTTASLFVSAMVLLQQNREPIDWIRLVTQAQKYQAILPLRNMLVTLRKLFAVSVPDWVVPALWQMPIARQEFLRYQVLPHSKKAILQSILWRSANSLKMTQ